ncbi:hypothetical protein PG997_007964 [Apiospora hydei]|uniref:Uncharacterized protein n=1 Tax=Apiospora hydei TaxID=1337664 RepID=A0ABR1W9K2_9PEZI
MSSIDAPKAAAATSAPTDQALEVTGNADSHGADKSTPAVPATSDPSNLNGESSKNAFPESTKASNTTKANTRGPRKSKSDNDFSYGRISIVSYKDISKMRESSCQTDPIAISGEKADEAAPPTAPVATAAAAAVTEPASPTPQRSQNEYHAASKGSSTLIAHDGNKNSPVDIEKGTETVAVPNQDSSKEASPSGPPGPPGPPGADDDEAEPSLEKSTPSSVLVDDAPTAKKSHDEPSAPVMAQGTAVPNKQAQDTGEVKK